MNGSTHLAIYCHKVVMFGVCVWFIVVVRRYRGAGSDSRPSTIVFERDASQREAKFIWSSFTGASFTRLIHAFVSRRGHTVCLQRPVWDGERSKRDKTRRQFAGGRFYCKKKTERILSEVHIQTRLVTRRNTDSWFGLWSSSSTASSIKLFLKELHVRVNLQDLQSVELILNEGH